MHIWRRLGTIKTSCKVPYSKYKVSAATSQHCYSAKADTDIQKWMAGGGRGAEWLSRLGVKLLIALQDPQGDRCPKFSSQPQQWQSRLLCQHLLLEDSFLSEGICWPTLNRSWQHNLVPALHTPHPIWSIQGCAGKCSTNSSPGRKAPNGSTCSSHWSTAGCPGDQVPPRSISSYQLTPSSQNSWKFNNCLVLACTSQLQYPTKSTQQILKCVITSTLHSWKTELN